MKDMTLDSIIADNKAKAIDMIKSKAEIYKNSTVYRNGIYTTVKWGDGTVTTVKCKEDDENDDVEAFINALANKVFDGRSALKRHVKKNTVDVAEKKRKKVEKKTKRREAKKVDDTPKIRDSKGQELHIGDKVFVDFDDKYTDLLSPYGQLRLEEIKGKIATVTDFDNEGLVILGYAGEVAFYYTTKDILTKVKTKPPFTKGDYVVIDKPKNEKQSSSWCYPMDNCVGKPLKVLDEIDRDGTFRASKGDEHYDAWWYNKDWVRKV